MLVVVPTNGWLRESRQGSKLVAVARSTRVRHEIFTNNTKQTFELKVSSRSAFGILRYLLIPRTIRHSYALDPEVTCYSKDIILLATLLVHHKIDFHLSSFLAPEIRRLDHLRTPLYHPAPFSQKVGAELPTLDVPRLPPHD